MSNNEKYAELNMLSQRILDHFDEFVEFFELDLNLKGDKYYGCCPIHAGADNYSAFTFFADNGGWNCRTHNCHNVFRRTPIGFIRALLSRDKLGWQDVGDDSKIYPFGDCLKFIEDFLKGSKPKHSVAERQVIQKVRKKTSEPIFHKITKADFLSNIDCPAQYFINRGFSSEILSKYYVGLYTQPSRPFSGRVLVPIFDDDGDYIIGCTSRAVHEKCLVCNGYHDPLELCKDPKYDFFHFQKWTHSKGLPKEQILYNYWNAKHYVRQTKKIILVEGTGEVWKLEECDVHNSMGIFGSTLNELQLNKILDLEPELLTTITDNDEAGEQIAINIQKLVSEARPELQIQHLVPPKKDLGEMSPEEIHRWIISVTNS